MIRIYRQKKESFHLNYFLHFLKFLARTNSHVARVHRCFPQSCGMLRCNENSVDLTRNWAARPGNWVRLPAEAEIFFLSLLYCVQTDCGAHPTSQCVPGLKGSGRSAIHLPLHLLYSYRTRTV